MRRSIIRPSINTRYSQKKYITESEVLDYLLSVNDQLREIYAVYQDLLTAFDAKVFETFFEIIDHLPATFDIGFKKAIPYLKKHKTAISNSLKFPYSNGKLGGKNNLIKVIKRIAFGLKTFRNLRKRVLIQQNLCEII